MQSVYHGAAAPSIGSGYPLTEGVSPMDNKEFILERKRIATRVSLYSIIVNVVLSVGKLAAGLLGHSAAMVSDAIHSAFRRANPMTNTNTATNGWSASPPSSWPPCWP